MPTETTDRWPSMRTRPVRDGVEGITISETEYCMTEAEIIRLSDLLDAALDRLGNAAVAAKPRDPIYGNYRGNGRYFFRDVQDKLHGPFLSEDSARSALKELDHAN